MADDSFAQRLPRSGATGAAGSEKHPRNDEDASGSGLARAGPEASGGGSANAGHGWRGRRQRHSPYYCGEVAGCGKILINTHRSATSLDAQCSRCLRRINRKYRPHASRGEAHQQGRPMGSLISWLQLTCNGITMRTGWTTNHTSCHSRPAWQRGAGGWFQGL